jgi:hypothetical protein
MARELAAVEELRRALGEQLATFRKAADLTKLSSRRPPSATAPVSPTSKKGAPRRRAVLAGSRHGLCGGRRPAGRLPRADSHRQGARKHARDVELADARAKVARAPHEQSEADEQTALELARRVAASDVGDETLTRLEAVVDELATAYPTTPPAALLGRIRQYAAYVHSLLDARQALVEHGGCS